MTRRWKGYVAVHAMPSCGAMPMSLEEGVLLRKRMRDVPFNLDRMSFCGEDIKRAETQIDTATALSNSWERLIDEVAEDCSLQDSMATDASAQLQRDLEQVNSDRSACESEIKALVKEFDLNLAPAGISCEPDRDRLAEELHKLHERARGPGSPVLAQAEADIQDLLKNAPATTKHGTMSTGTGSQTVAGPSRLVKFWYGFVDEALPLLAGAATGIGLLDATRMIKPSYPAGIQIAVGLFGGLLGYLGVRKIGAAWTSLGQTLAQYRAPVIRIRPKLFDVIIDTALAVGLGVVELCVTAFSLWTFLAECAKYETALHPKVPTKPLDFAFCLVIAAFFNTAFFVGKYQKSYSSERQRLTELADSEEERENAKMDDQRDSEYVRQLSDMIDHLATISGSEADGLAAHWSGFFKEFPTLPDAIALLGLIQLAVKKEAELKDRLAKLESQIAQPTPVITVDPDVLAGLRHAATEAGKAAEKARAACDEVLRWYQTRDSASYGQSLNGTYIAGTLSASHPMSLPGGNP